MAAVSLLPQVVLAVVITTGLFLLPPLAVSLQLLWCTLLLLTLLTVLVGSAVGHLVAANDVTVHLRSLALM